MATGNDGDKRTELLKVLEIAEARRRYHHNALWEEQKHFTWWVALIAPAIVGVHLQGATLTDSQKAGLMLAGCVLGMFISGTAIYVIWREGREFRDTLLAVNRAAHGLGLDDPQTYAVLIGQPLPIFPPDYPLRSEGFAGGGLGVRGAFQSVFVVAILLFIGFAVWAVFDHGYPRFL